MADAAADRIKRIALREAAVAHARCGRWALADETAGRKKQINGGAQDSDAERGNAMDVAFARYSHALCSARLKLSCESHLTVPFIALYHPKLTRENGSVLWSLWSLRLAVTAVK